MNTLLYRRVSTNRQDTSLETQELSGDRYIAAHDGEMVCREPEDVFEDNDTSGSVPFAERPGGRALLQRVRGFGTEDTGVRHVVVSKLDRLGRDLADFLAVWKLFTAAGVALHIADEGNKSFNLANKDDFLMLVIKMAIAQYELLTIRERTKQNLQTKFDNGLLTGSVPYGHNVELRMTNDEVRTIRNNYELQNLRKSIGQNEWKALRKELVANEQEQHWIHWMHQWHTQEHWTYKQIAHQLNLNGAPPKEPAGVVLNRKFKPNPQSEIRNPQSITDGVWKIGMVASILNSKHTARILQTSAPAQAIRNPQSAIGNP